MADLSVWQPDADPDIPTFPMVLWGYQRRAVDRYLRSLPQTAKDRGEIIELDAAQSRPADKLGRYRDLGMEIGDLLAAVEETVARIREAAEGDAARWREQASLEAQNRVTAAQATAEELRGAAWDVSMQMITQIQDLEQEARRGIEKHSHGVIAEVENEAHRVRGEARRRADSIRSNAHVEAIELEERTRALCDQMINSAEQKVAAIQERVLALERHRDQLLEEIGGIRSGVAPIGVKLVDQTGGLIYPSSAEGEEPVHVTPHHEMSGLVKVITPAEESENVVEEQESSETPEGAEALPRPAKPAEVAPEPNESTPRPSDGLLEDLFASLRLGATPAGSAEPDSEAPVVGEPPQMDGDQSIEMQEEMLLPISSQFLRQFKRMLTEEQNRVLEGLRTGQLDWEARGVDGRLRSHLELLVEQSWQAGHRAAEKLMGRSLSVPEMAAQEEPGFASQLVDEVNAAIGAEGSGETAQRSRLASRIFRVWRNEKLEQYLREVSERYYEQGLAGSLNTAGVVSS